ncbi:MAG TPA: hypothetical protein VMC07_01600, partial [Candidatus Omnitrophota bacterium]|nr:hypothetical protein [Candidatus Omnitrophota bacterium]
DAIGQNYTLKLLYHSGTSPDFSNFSIEKDFNISVGIVQTDFEVVVQSTSGTQVSLGIVNTGINAANSLIMSIPQQSSFRASGISQQIIGNLAAGDYTIATFSITPTGGSGGGNRTGSFSYQAPQSLKVEINYTDVTGIRRGIIKEVPYSTSSSGNFSEITGRAVYGRNSGGISAWWFVGGGIIVIAAGFLIYKKYGHKLRKSKKNNSEKTPDWIAAEKAKGNKK